MSSIKGLAAVTLLLFSWTSLASADLEEPPPEPTSLDLMPQDARIPSDPTTPDDLPDHDPIELRQADESTTAPSAEPKNEAPRGFFSLWEQAPLTGPEITDRPGFADSTYVLPRGHVQLELGYTYTSDSEKRTQFWDHTIGQTNLRVGLADNLEFRTIWNGFSMTESEFDSESPRTGRRYRTDDHNDGAADMLVGLRTQLVKNEGLIPDLTLLANMSIPVGTDNKTAGDVVPDARLAYGWALTEKLRLYGVGIVAAGVHESGHFPQAAGSAGLSYAITDRIGTFVEYYGIFPGREDEDCSHNADGGVAFLLNDNCQLDFSAGLGLNEQAADYFLGMGISFRW